MFKHFFNIRFCIFSLFWALFLQQNHPEDRDGLKGRVRFGQVGKRKWFFSAHEGGALDRVVQVPAGTFLVAQRPLAQLAARLWLWLHATQAHRGCHLLGANYQGRLGDYCLTSLDVACRFQVATQFRTAALLRTRAAQGLQRDF
jgi:hypothetical protein